jgi:hypothetical protein
VKRLVNWLGLLFIACVSLPAPAAFAGETNTLLWHAKQGQFEARIAHLELAEALTNIAEQTRWRVFVEPGLQQTLSAKFGPKPAGEALKMMLGSTSFALIPQANGSANLYIFRQNQVAATERIRPKPAGKVVPNELLIQLKPGVRPETLAAQLGAKITGRIEGLNAHRFRFEDPAAAERARQFLERHDDAASVDSIFLVERPQRPEAVNAPALPAFTLKASPAPEGGSLVVGLVDTAVQPSDALSAWLLPGIGVAGAVQLSDTVPTHGTSMLENLLRAYGQVPAGQQTAPLRVLPVDVYGANSSTTTFEVALGIQEALNAGASIINLSLGGTGDSQFLHTLIQQAHSRGVLFVAAAGNSPVTTPTYPAAYPEVLAVTAVDAKGQLATYANRGQFVDVGAPGGSLVHYGGKTYYVAGTSSASAFVSGLAAGLSAQTGKKPQEISTKLLELLPVKLVP